MEEMIVEQQNGRNYLVCRLETETIIDEDCLAVVSEELGSDGKQGIPGIIPIIYSQIFEERILKYDINAYVSLAKYKKQITTGKQICTLFLSILETYSKLEAYLLDPGYFLTNEEYIFVNEAQGRAYFILYPVYSIQKEIDFREFFGKMMTGIHIRNEDMDFYGKLIYELNYTDTFNIIKFKDFLTNTLNAGVRENVDNGSKKPESREAWKKTKELQENIRCEGKEKPVKAQESKEKAIKEKAVKEKTVKEKTVKEKAVKEKQPREKMGLFSWGKTKKAKSHSMISLPDEEEIPSDFELRRDNKSAAEVSETELEEMTKLDKEGETEIVSDQKQLILIHTSTGREIPVRQFPFVIGREGSGFRIDPSKLRVGRRHAVIISQQDEFFICDESKNGTWADGERLPKGENIALSDGMHLRLTEEEFDVKIYEA